MSKMKVYVDWTQSGTSLVEIDDNDLLRAAAAGVNLDDQRALGAWVEKEMLALKASWLHDVVSDNWVDKDRPEITNPLLVEGDPPQWWIDEHPEPDL